MAYPAASMGKISSVHSASLPRRLSRSLRATRASASACPPTTAPTSPPFTPANCHTHILRCQRNFYHNSHRTLFYENYFIGMASVSLTLFIRKASVLPSLFYRNGHIVIRKGNKNKSDNFIIIKTHTSFLANSTTRFSQPTLQSKLRPPPKRVVPPLTFPTTRKSASSH